MQTFTLVSGLLVAMVVLLNAPQPARAVCCGSFNVITTIIGSVGPIQIREPRCGDCSVPTPYCGYGPCNIFGCNCDGGCRKGSCSGKSARADNEEIEYNSTSLVEAGDENGDQALSFTEAKALLKSKGVSVRSRQLKKLDKNRDGRLSANEIDAN